MVRFSNFTLVDISGFTFDANLHGGAITVVSGTAIYNFRIHHNRFINSNSNDSGEKQAGIYTRGLTYGLIDNNVFYNNSNAIVVLGGLSTMNMIWANFPGITNVGTKHYLYIENNNVSKITSPGHLFLGETGEGARWVARYNSVDHTDGGSTMDFHGDTGNRGVVAGEFYENTMTADTDPLVGGGGNLQQRGGTGLIYNNSFQYGTSGIRGGDRIAEYHASCSNPGGCPDDGGGCGDQVHNSYHWNNKNTRDDTLMYLSHRGQGEWNVMDPYHCIDEKVNFWVDTQPDIHPTVPTTYFTKGLASGRSLSTCADDDVYWETDTKKLYRCVGDNNWTFIYQPYTYPHPLRTGVTPPDTTSPSRSSGSPSGTLTTGTTQTTISLTTNESATCKYSTTPNTAYGSIANTFSTTGGTAHSQTVTGLTDGNTYNYYVRCVDALNNVNTNDYTITFSVGSDSAPPTGSISINSGDEYTTSETTSLSISASDPSGVAQMKISNTNDFNAAILYTYNTVKSWVLTAGDGLKTVYAWFKDSLGNWTSESNPVMDTITLDETVPIISNITTSDIITTSATISFNTNENTTSYVEYGLTTSYGNQTETNATGIMNYEVGITGLSDNTEYNYRITSTDPATNSSQSTNQTFTTTQSSTPDTTPPADITSLTSSNITQTSASLNWTSPGDDNNTGTASTYDLRYSTSNITNNTEFNNATQLSGEPIPAIAGTSQSLYIAVGLSPNTTYYFAIKTSDEVPNISNLSNILSITTLAESTPPSGGGGGGGGGGTVSDTTPPSNPGNFTAIPAESQITLTWSNPTNSDFVRVKILRKENNPPTSHNDETATIIYEGTNEEYTDIELDNNITYHYAIFAYDQKPNYSEILSISSQPIEGKTTIEKPKTPQSICFGFEPISLFGLNSEMADCISLREAKIAHNHNQNVALSDNEKRLYQKIAPAESLNKLTLSHKYSLAHFINSYTDTTKILGSGERAGVINSYRSAFNKLPQTVFDWQDIIKIANGRWPTERSEQAENRAKQEFEKVYLRAANMENPNDNAAVTVIAYGLRPANRNLNSEKAGIRIFKAIYGYNPESAVDWDVVRAIAYSGCER